MIKFETIDDGELRSLRERNELLEALSDVGVALAGSFDIRAILETTHRAARRVSRERAIDVLYLGCDAINSRMMWYPAEPGPMNVSTERRQAVAARLESPPHECEREDGRLRLPISYQNEQLGFLFVAGDENPDAETARLLSILTLQAATALRNIHLTQERIHFERLSAIGRMIGSVVHDFRSPLTALRGYAGMLTNLELEASERAAYGSYVIDECDRLNHMVSELLEFTRGGSFELEPQWVRLGAYLESFAGRLRTQFAPGDIRVELELDFTDRVRIDEARMHRALWNVATNACQAMPDGGRLWLSTQKTDDGFAIVIRDEGTGIPEDVRHRIFEPFFSYGKAEGIGLGMQIARKIIEEHGGTIRVESEAGTGTCVCFELPTGVATESTIETAAVKHGD